MSKNNDLYFEIAKEVEDLNMKYNLSFEASLRMAKEKYKEQLKEIQPPTDQSKEVEENLYNEILTLKKNISNRR